MPVLAHVHDLQDVHIPPLLKSLKFVFGHVHSPLAVLHVYPAPPVSVPQIVGPVHAFHGSVVVVHAAKLLELQLMHTTLLEPKVPPFGSR